ncbi:MAG: hypothetical protein M3534_16380, partial [Actinomycetota bacterium]|nr:hypothetical protein [Actinomycetota bacterium]
MAKSDVGSGQVEQKVVGDKDAAEDARALWLLGVPFRTLRSRVVNRFLKVLTQTLFAPLLTSALYV